VQEPFLVHGLQTLEQRPEHRGEPCLVGREPAPKERVERLALLVVHHHVAGTVRLEGAVHAHDVGMAELLEPARLLEEALEPPLVVVPVPGGERRDAAVERTQRKLHGQVFLDRDGCARCASRPR
jgi:hypothetical protein